MENDKQIGLPEQKLLLLMKRTERISGKRYLRLVALDYLKGNVLTLYDDNGESDLVLHSWNKETDSLREMAVIKAKFYPDNKQEYAVRTAGNFVTLSEGGSLKPFLKKVYVQSLLSVIEGESNLPFPVSNSDILENADNISIDQSFYNALHYKGLGNLPEISDFSSGSGSYNSEMPAFGEEEDMIFDAYWYYDEDEDTAFEEYSISEDDNLSFEWSFGNEKQISFREGEYQLVDANGAVFKEKYLSLIDTKILVTDEKTGRETNQGKYFNGFALIRRSGESFVADKLYGKFEKIKRPPYIEELKKEFQQLEEKILMAATRNKEEDAYNGGEIQYSEVEGFGAEKSPDENKKYKTIRSEIAGEYPDYIVTDIYADDFATEYGSDRGAAKKDRKAV